ncbi:uncharacterized protein CANTADRAFT_88917 [Suhomyces tanzawaensis NRRL Y-17324]|uniref:Uncharacterized protein n=1 Tax=Suhomyces tanzawaensis NRRL Y-17324 TaxID=984487 RepID=A0A1E4SNB1_9ASCO|nr:uncharacterized protein CANTADRAFT_88917 [Suhomyces tanzawaensis NRRL Y-17324]ODV81014.1 hypothetical protein CANTADRAFT_88917 [Suhomyces tanzawaensis NRRL Y-17324]
MVIFKVPISHETLGTATPCNDGLLAGGFACQGLVSLTRTFISEAMHQGSMYA